MIYSAARRSQSALPDYAPPKDAQRLFDVPSLPTEPETVADELCRSLPASSLAEEFDLQLASQIISRIEARLPGRISNLKVHATKYAVVLSGRCSTFYTKQLAQHAAMGVLQYERLVNKIVVRIAK